MDIKCKGCRTSKKSPICLSYRAFIKLGKHTHTHTHTHITALSSNPISNVPLCFRDRLVRGGKRWGEILFLLYLFFIRDFMS